MLTASLTVSTNSTREADRGTFNQRVTGMVQAKQAAGEHVRYVDMGALDTGDLADGLHPDDAGYRKTATAFHDGILAAESADWPGEPVTRSGEVRSAFAGTCMDVDTGSTANGTAVQLCTCDNTGGQRWTASADGTLRALGKCLDAEAGGTANGTRTVLWDCHGGADQKWTRTGRIPRRGRCRRRRADLVRMVEARRKDGNRRIRGGRNPVGW